MKLNAILASLALAAAPAAAQAPAPRTLEVPSRISTIQAAIDSARSGDSVLVAPGHYRENIRFKGKSIVLASRFARTRDPQDILATIIDGSTPSRADTGSTVLIVDREDSTTVLEGFTIVGGPGTIWYDAAGHSHFREGGAILCDLSSPAIRFNRILGGAAVAMRDRRIRSSGGGGIRCGFAEPTIEGNVIAVNHGRYGGGLVLFHCASVVRFNVFAANGGGEDFGGAGAWIVGNLSRRVSTDVSHNSFAGNRAFISMDSSAVRSLTGTGGGALFGVVNADIRDNLFMDNTQIAGRQLVLGVGVVGTVNGNDEQSDTNRTRSGPYRVPDLRAIGRGAFGPSASELTRSVLLALLQATDSVALRSAGPDLALRRAELMAADSVFGAQKSRGTVRRLSEPLAPNALVIGPRNSLWRGPDAVRAALADDTLNAKAIISWSPIRGDVSADGRHGYTFGYLDFAASKAPRREWKYLAYWERSEAGSWRMLAYKRLPRDSGAHETSAPTGFETPRRRDASWFPSGAAELAKLMSLDSAFARSAQLDVVKAFQQFTAADGATLSGNASVAWGREKVAAEFAGFAAGTIDWAPDHAALAGSGDLGFATGEVIIRQRQPDGSFTEAARGRYLTIWQRQADGSWKLVIDG